MALLSQYSVKKPRRSAASPTFFASSSNKISYSKTGTYYLAITYSIVSNPDANDFSSKNSK
jgi:hypothetical protein